MIGANLIRKEDIRPEYISRRKDIICVFGVRVTACVVFLKRAGSMAAVE
jgi:hypothetical protein